jgi:hypothetical protein
MARYKTPNAPNYNDYFDWKSSCKKRGYEIQLTLQEWLNIWINSGRWNERGRGRHDSCMGRIDVEKGYSVENVSIIQVKDKHYTRNKTKRKSNLAPDLK